MGIFNRRISAPNQLATLRELEGNVDVGKVGVRQLVGQQGPLTRVEGWRLEAGGPMHAHACPCICGQPHDLRPASGIPSATVCVQKGWFLGLLCCWAAGQAGDALCLVQASSGQAKAKWD